MIDDLDDYEDDFNPLIKKYVSVRLEIGQRKDGGLWIRSDDILGLNLSHPDAGKVWADLGPALSELVRLVFDFEPIAKRDKPDGA